MQMVVAKAKAEKVSSIRYTKEQLLKSKRYRNKVDILSIVLDQYGLYTTKETDKLVADFLKGKVR